MTNPVPQNDGRASKVPSGRRLLVIGVAALVAVGLAIPAAIFGPQLVGLGQPASEAPPTSASAAAPAPAGFTEYRNEQVGFAMSYPASWGLREAPENQPEDPQTLLRVADETGGNALVIRAVELEKSVSPQELPAAGKVLTDLLKAGNPEGQLLYEPDALEVAGLPTHRIFFSFMDDITGLQGVHIHYFVFKEKAMLTFIFQTVPLENLRASAPLFDQIINSVHLL